MASKEDRTVKKIQQGAAVYIVATRFRDGSTHPAMVCVDLHDAMEFARMFYRTEDVVLVDNWGGALGAEEEFRTWWSSEPRAMARADKAKPSQDGRRPYVDLVDQELRIYVSTLATFADVETPECVIHKVKAGKYTMGTEDNPARFILINEGGKHPWKVSDYDADRSYSCIRTLERAKAKVLGILHREQAVTSAVKRCLAPH